MTCLIVISCLPRDRAQWDAIAEKIDTIIRRRRQAEAKADNPMQIS